MTPTSNWDRNLIRNSQSPRTGKVSSNNPICSVADRLNRKEIGNEKKQSNKKRNKRNISINKKKLGLEI